MTARSMPVGRSRAERTVGQTVNLRRPSGEPERCVPGSRPPSKPAARANRSSMDRATRQSPRSTAVPAAAGVDSAVARCRRRSAAATPSADGDSDELHLHDASAGGRSDFEARVAEHFPHGHVVAQHRRVKRAKSATVRMRGQPLEQQRRDAFALEPIVYGESDLCCRVGQRKIGRDRDDAGVPATERSARSVNALRGSSELVNRSRSC